MNDDQQVGAKLLSDLAIFSISSDIALDFWK